MQKVTQGNQIQNCFPKEKIFFRNAYQFFYKKSDVSHSENKINLKKDQNGRRDSGILEFPTTDVKDMNSSGDVSDSASAASESDDFEYLI